MDNFGEIQPLPVERVGRIGISIAKTNAGSLHVGILLRESGGGGLGLLHLAFHYLFRYDPVGNEYIHFRPKLSDRKLLVIAAACRRIWKANEKHGIPYAFSDPGSAFDRVTDVFQISEKRHGLTCASFVVAAFEHAGVKLLDLNSWPSPRPDDIGIQKALVNLLRSRGADARHINAVQDEIGNVRIRPEEVVGASQVPPFPASYQAAANAALHVLTFV